jgi:putative transposase
MVDLIHMSTPSQTNRPAFPGRCPGLGWGAPTALKTKTKNQPNTVKFAPTRFLAPAARPNLTQGNALGMAGLELSESGHTSGMVRLHPSEHRAYGNTPVETHHPAFPGRCPGLGWGAPTALRTKDQYQSGTIKFAPTRFLAPAARPNLTQGNALGMAGLELLEYRDPFGIAYQTTLTPSQTIHPAFPGRCPGLGWVAPFPQPHHPAFPGRCPGLGWGAPTALKTKTKNQPDTVKFAPTRFLAPAARPNLTQGNALGMAGLELLEHRDSLRMDDLDLSEHRDPLRMAGLDLLEHRDPLRVSCLDLSEHRDPLGMAPRDLSEHPTKDLQPMPHSLVRLHTHLVFGTKTRTPWINDSVRDALHGYMANVLTNLGCTPILINSVEDHVHVLFDLARMVSIGQCVEDLKKSSSKWLKTAGPELSIFSWQSGYAAFSVSQSQMESVCQYIANQREHHQRKSFQDEYRLILKKHGVIFDEK